MPIKTDEQQQQPNGHSIGAHKTHHQVPMIEVPTANDNILEASNDNILEKKTNPEMISAGDHSELNLNGSQSDEQVKTNSPTILNNNYTTMHQPQGHTNKRKLNELDLISSSDSCGSSSCSSNDVGLESNSNSAAEELERSSKRQKINIHNIEEVRDHFGMLNNPLPAATLSANAATAIDLNQASAIDNKQQKDDDMMMDESSTQNTTTCYQQPISVFSEVCMDSNEDLTSVARLVTEQIVTKVSDCYMDI